MFLIIDNTEKEKNTFSFWVDNKFVQRTYKSDSGVLVCLEELLSSLKLELKDIDCLGVVMGEGRFTATRLAVTAANALAFSLKIPVVALPKIFAESSALKFAKSAVAGKYIVPTYSGEAHVG